MQDELRPHYVLPRHASENDRLNLTTWAFDAAMGTSFLAPVIDPRNTVDVGCGTGLWAYHFGRRFPSSQVLGVDVEDFRDSGPPPNFEFRKVNVLQGLPFEDGTFDYAHQRLMVAAYPIVKYAAGVAELVRVVRPGGWVELLEAFPHPEPEGPAAKELWDYFGRLGRTVDQDSLGIIPERLELYLKEAGLLSVQKRTVTVPSGEWGAELGEWQGRAGAMIAQAMRSLLTRLAPTFETKLGLPEERCRELISVFLAEVNELRSSGRFKVAFGQRPG